MRSVGLKVAAVAIAVACRRETAAPEITQLQPDWDSLNASLPADPALQARMLESYRQRRGFLMWFLPGSDSTAVGRLIVDQTHMCAPVIPAFVQRIPHSDSVLRSLRVVEVDSTGRVLSTWHIPVGVTIVGVRGDSLVTSVGERPADVNFLIRPDGRFTIDTLEYRRASRPVWPQGVCPTRDEFRPLTCAEFRDGARRRLILHPPRCGSAPG